MDLSAIFRMPMSIVARSSTITNSFVNSIIPVIEPTEDDVLEALHILGIGCNRRALRLLRRPVHGVGPLATTGQ
jgi:hypothetical protein